MSEEGARSRVEIAPAARREFRRLRPDEGARLRGPILALGLDPRPPGSQRVVGTDLWRIRVGECRIVYLIDETERRVVVLRIARRSERAYPGLG